MKRKLFVMLMITAFCLLAAIPALAADVFKFEETSIVVFEDEQVTPVIRREGAYAEGEIVFTTDNNKVLRITEDGTIIPLSKGTTTVYAALKQNGKTVRRSQISVKVARRVTKVTLSMKNLTVYEADDPVVTGVMKERPEDAEPLTNPVIVIPAGKSAALKVVCTPEDATNRKVSYATSDAGVLKVTAEGSIRGVEKGECDLTISSVQNPEVFEVFHVVVIEPVKKIRIEAPDKTVFAGESMSLDAVCTPETASMTRVTWSSRQPAIATVDEYGTVTGIKKGQVTIDATATDGSGIVGSIVIKVAQEVTEIQLKQTEATVATKRKVQLNATALPKEADNRSLKWTSSDESIATVSQYGEVTGKKAGICVITCTSVSNPAVSASAVVQVVQPVTKITFTSPSGLSFPIRTSQQLTWTVEPADATIQDVTFKSSSTKIATVDENGVVTGISRGTVTITATATDGSNKTGTFRVTITQPVEGVTLQQPMYYIQRGRYTNIKATVLPKDANNQSVWWEVGDPSLASVRSNGTATGRVTGLQNGATTITAITEDGGFTASAGILVGDFDSAVRIESLWIQDNKIKIALWNTSNITVEKVFFHIECFDTQNYPMVYNKDGTTTGFDGSYPLTLQPQERSIHGQFLFNDMMETGLLGGVTMTIYGYQFEGGQKWWVPDEYQVPMTVYSGYMWTPTPTPLPAQDEEPAGG